MNKAFTTLSALVCMVLCFSSCLNDKDEVDYTIYSDMAITQMTLGTLNRYTHTVSSTSGNDTVIKTTVTGGNYRMTIDQIGHRIFNQDLLPVGTDTKHVLVTIGTKNGSTALLKSLISDSLFYVRNTDSLDFSVPRILRVYAANGSGYRDYTVELNVSATTGVNFGWRLCGTYDHLKGWTGRQLVATEDSALLMDAGTAWFKGQAIDVSQTIRTYIGATGYEMFGLDDANSLRSSTDGKNWSEEALDAEAGLLPTTAMSMTSWPYAPSDFTDYILLVGNNHQGDHSVVWRKIASSADGQGQWVYLPFDDNNSYYLPAMDWYSMTYYNDAVLCLGSDKQMWRSRDQGITWQTSSVYAIPSGFQGDEARIAADANGHLWLVTNAGQVWCGSVSE